MRKLGVWGMAVTLCLGLAASRGRAGDDKEEASPPSRVAAGVHVGRIRA